jgi:hypothetical protein
MFVNPSLIRLTWAVIEETSSHELLNLADTALVRFLMQRVSTKILLNSDEVGELYNYIGSNILLIRDMAESRLAVII